VARRDDRKNRHTQIPTDLRIDGRRIEMRIEKAVAHEEIDAVRRERGDRGACAASPLYA
jgi:hypothetical protein